MKNRKRQRSSNKTCNDAMDRLIQVSTTCGIVKKKLTCILHKTVFRSTPKLTFLFRVAMVHKAFLKFLKKRIMASSITSCLIYWGIRLLFRSYRLHIVSSSPEIPFSTKTTPGIFYFWHQDIIAGMYFFFATNSVGHCVVSPSNDGKLIGSLCTKLGFTVLYGSAFKNPTTLLKNCLNVLKAKGSLCLVGDGSRGPAKVLQPGISYLAAKTTTPLYFVSASASRSITSKKSWDNFRVPLPFSTITIRVEPQTPQQRE